MKHLRRNETPLFIAAAQGHLETVKYLLDNGADVNQPTTDGESALIGATWGCHRHVARLLMAHGADVNIRNQAYGMTPLMFAVQCGDIKLVQFLIQSGADITVKDSSGVSPLMMAVWQNSAVLVETLIDAGIDVNAVANEGVSPLYEAAALCIFQSR